MLDKLIIFFKNLFFIKIWNIGYIKISKDFFLNLSDLNYIEKNFTPLNLKYKNYIFFADPFPLTKTLLFAEAINKKNIGELVLIDIFKNKIIKKFQHIKGHVSFPSIFCENKNIFLVPEISHWSNQMIFKFNSKQKKIISKFKLTLESKSISRIKDPILIKKKKSYFLFFTVKNSKKVEVFHSQNLYGVYKSVKNISKDDAGFRMGGQIIKLKNKEFRISQNNTDLYGDGIKINKIIKLDKNFYEENFLKTLKFHNFYGPHTINFFNNYFFFDYYFLKFDLFAIFKKLKLKIFA